MIQYINDVRINTDPSMFRFKNQIKNSTFVKNVLDLYVNLEIISTRNNSLTDLVKSVLNDIYAEPTHQIFNKIYNGSKWKSYDSHDSDTIDLLSLFIKSGQNEVNRCNAAIENRNIISSRLASIGMSGNNFKFYESLDISVAGLRLLSASMKLKQEKTQQLPSIIIAYFLTFLRKILADSPQILDQGGIEFQTLVDNFEEDCGKQGENQGIYWQLFSPEKLSAVLIRTSIFPKDLLKVTLSYLTYNLEQIMHSLLTFPEFQQTPN